LKRSTWPTWIGTPVAADAATSLSASAGVAASGFSTSIAIPRSAAASASGRWVVVGEAITTASRSASPSMAIGSR
jgi:hypothetical protein